MFYTKSFLCIYIKSILFGLFQFDCISTIPAYLIIMNVCQIYMISFVSVWWHISYCRLFNTKCFFAYILNLYSWFVLVWWYINHCRFLNIEPLLCIYIKYIWLGLFRFDGISTIVGYLISNPLYAYILNIYDLVCLGLMAYQLL